MIERTLIYWWRGIETIFKKNNEISFIYSGKRYEFINYTSWQKKKNYQNFMKVIHQNKDNLEETINPLLDKYGIDIQKILDDEALNENELKKLSSSHLVTLGSHAITHKSLKLLAEDQIYHELAESKNYLEAITGKPTEHLAYPFGGPNDVSDREIRIAKQLGYATAVATRKGTIKSTHKDYLQALPRLSFNQDFELISWMEFQRTGIASQLKRKTIDPVFITM